MSDEDIKETKPMTPEEMAVELGGLIEEIDRQDEKDAKTLEHYHQAIDKLATDFDAIMRDTCDDSLKLAARWSQISENERAVMMLSAAETMNLWARVLKRYGLHAQIIWRIKPIESVLEHELALSAM